MSDEVNGSGLDPHDAVPFGIDEFQGKLKPKVFSTGSRGWFYSGKADIYGTRCQINVICTIVGSKPSANGVQPATAPEKALEGPPIVSALFPEDLPAKRRPKRS